MITSDVRFITFTVPAIPVAQPRQRHRVVQAKSKTFVQNYVPRKHPVGDFKAVIRLAFQSAAARPPFEGPVGLKLAFVLPRPRTMIWKTKPMPRLRRSSGRMDWDNLAKAFTDALNGLAWRDDSQICIAHVELFVAGGDEGPGVEARIWELNGEDAK